MRQVVVSGAGEVQVVEVPRPAPVSGCILVRNVYSLISSGTEGASVSTHSGVLGLAERALASSDRLAQVAQMIRTRGLLATLETVNAKLHDLSALGYGSAGIVEGVYGDAGGGRIGDAVACMGAGVATHSDYIVVPSNLYAPLHPSTDLRYAAFGAVGCIAMQGLRRLEMQPGEVVAVVGLGLIGQLTIQLARAFGYQVVGFDVSPERAAHAEQNSGVPCFADGSAAARETAASYTKQRGFDGVVLTASTSSSDPMNLAFDLLRKRGRVSVVGAVGLDLDRARMYAKEIEVRMSCSYGPGRYDDRYEWRGHDYPAEYVRFTEARNLEHFIRLLEANAINPQSILSREFGVVQAPEAFRYLKGGAVGAALLTYSSSPQSDAQTVSTLPAHASGILRKQKTGRIALGLIGAGSFLRSVHAPNLRRFRDEVVVRSVVSQRGLRAAIVAKELGAIRASTDVEDVLSASDIDAVLITTRHSSHADYVLRALQAGKHVFVEKPMCLTVSQGEEIVREAARTGLTVRVGFNRRFAPALLAMRGVFGKGGPRAMTMRVNVGAIGADWSNVTEEGGRFLGEAVHFLDLSNWIAGSAPESVFACFVGDRDPLNPNLMVTMRYPTGFASTLAYSTLGDSAGGKEYFEAFGGARWARCDDYQRLVASGSRATGFARGDKGHRQALREFLSAIRGSPGEGADEVAGLAATAAALSALQSAGAGWISQGAGESSRG